MLSLRADTLTFTLPASWHEVSFGQFMALWPTYDSRKALLVLSGKGEGDFRPLRAPDLDSILTTHLAFLSALPNVDALTLPKTLTVRGQAIPIPQNLSAVTTIGQRWDIELVLRNMAPKKPRKGRRRPPAPMMMDVASTLLSVYLCPLITGTPYDGLDHAESVVSDLNALPCTSVLPVAAFFLRSYLTPSPSGNVSFRQLPPPTMSKASWFRWPAVLRSALSSLIPTLR